MLKRGTVVRLKLAEQIAGINSSPYMMGLFKQYDGKIGIVLGPGNYDGPNTESNFYEVLVGTIKMTVKDESLEEA